MLRRRIYAYLGIALIILWSLGTWYLAVIAHTNKSKMPTIEERAEILEKKIADVEKAISEQTKENRRLLDILQIQIKHASGSGVSLPPALRSLQLPPDHDNRIAVLVFACNRSKALKNHIDQLLKLRSSKDRFPVIISQDCRDQDTANVINSYGDKLTFIQQPDQSTITVPPKMKKFLGYYKIARHYRWALNQTFYTFGYQTAIITEDDLDLSADFFEYFTATYPLLHLDPSLMCVSAWNDNGKADKIENDSKRLYRTDFFPGLGWMLTRELWEELNEKWPEAFWDDWMRKPEQRKGRACIRPEISRTAMSLHGKVGVSKGLYFEKHLKHIQLSKEYVPFTKMDLSFLLKDRYDQMFVKNVYAGPSITQPELRAGKLNNGEVLPPSVRLTYEDKNTYKVTAKAFGLMDDFRAGVPRTAYRGVVPFMFGKTRVYLAPPATWKEYDPTWS